MNSAHTPSPWRVGWSLAGCWMVWFGDRYLTLQGADQEANARLIAAAPELLEALQATLRLIRLNAPDLSGKTIGFAEAAIAKALGEGV